MLQDLYVLYGVQPIVLALMQMQSLFQGNSILFPGDILINWMEHQSAVY